LRPSFVAALESPGEGAASLYLSATFGRNLSKCTLAKGAWEGARMAEEAYRRDLAIDSPPVEHITLDYAGARHRKDVLHSLSAIAAVGPYLWTASDERRTIECLKRDGKNYRLHDQIKLDKLFEDLPRSPSGARLTSNPLPSAATACGFAGPTARSE
jgi:hypothetical protein